MCDKTETFIAFIEEEVKKVLDKANLYAAPGTDGIPSLLYHKCWNTLGKHLTEVVRAIHLGEAPTKSMRSSLMVFGCKPKKINSLKPGDKRRISLLNSDFKVVTGIEALRFGVTATYSLSKCQLVAGSDRRIHHGINLARDAIFHAGKAKKGCGILDLDFLAGFDWLNMAWVYRVLKKKGVNPLVVDRLFRIYSDSTTTVVVNNVRGKTIDNRRGSLRQGDIPSMFWFSVGIDPLLVFLDRRLSGIPIYSLPLHGPEPEGAPDVPKELREVYRLVAYADDVKPSITSMEEFYLVDNACSMLERASGVKLHRDPAAGKVKFLALGKWRNSLTQQDMPHQYVILSDHLDFVGVELRSCYTQTRKKNGELLQSKVRNTIGPWQAGRFMHLCMRPFSINTYALSKVWYKCGSINLRLQDVNAINSLVKGWLYRDCLEKPSEIVLYRKTSCGGLGLLNVKIRSLALLIKTFMETAANPLFRHNLYHEALYRYHILGETTLTNPGYPPYYDKSFFDIIKQVREKSSLNVAVLSIRQWYHALLEDQLLMLNDDPPTPAPCKAETLYPSNNWDQAWANARMKGLDSCQTSFLFKLMHNILPTRSRLHRMRIEGNLTNCCGLCDLIEEEEDLIHAFFVCSNNSIAGLALLGYIQKIAGNVSDRDCLSLNFGTDLGDVERLAAVLILATGLSFIWEQRVQKKTVLLFTVRAELEAKVELLRKTRFGNVGNLIYAILNPDSRQ